MASFRGLTFDEFGSDRLLYPRFSRRAIHVVQRPPGGSRVIIQSSGQKEDTLSLEARMSEAQYTALNGAVDTHGSLSWSGGTRTAYLAAIENPRELVTTGEIEDTLTFVGM